jgi:hypothetical protein
MYMRKYRPGGSDGHPSAARDTARNLFDERIEPTFPKQVLQAIIERMSRRAVRRHQIALNRVGSPHRHR